MALDVDALLQAVSDEEPAGPDLSYDPDFRRISRELDDLAAKERPGDDPSVLPNLQTAIDLLGRSRDLWIASHGACFALYAGDLQSMTDLVRAMAAISESFWATCYPVLEEGSDSAGGRREACRQLAIFGRTIKHLERMYLPPLKSKGRLSFKDVAGAADERATGQQMLDQMGEPVRRAVDETGLGEWEAFSATLEGLQKAIAGLMAVFSANDETGQVPDLSPLTAMLERIKKLSDAIVVRKSPVPEIVPDAAGEPGTGGGGAIRGPVSSRAQALQQLEAIKSFFQHTELSSPIPFLLDRVIRIANMNFMEIMQNVAPSGFDDATRLLEPPQPPPQEYS